MSSGKGAFFGSLHIWSLMAAESTFIKAIIRIIYLNQNTFLTSFVHLVLWTAKPLSLLSNFSLVHILLAMISPMWSDARIGVWAEMEAAKRNSAIFFAFGILAGITPLAWVIFGIFSEASKALCFELAEEIFNSMKSTTLELHLWSETGFIIRTPAHIKGAFFYWNELENRCSQKYF